LGAFWGFFGFFLKKCLRRFFIVLQLRSSLMTTQQTKRKRSSKSKPTKTADAVLLPASADSKIEKAKAECLTGF